jgi:1,4-dihydroxy-2-naphthoyl-CoA synthase
MHSFALRRIKANFCYFNNFARNFCQNNTAKDSKTNVNIEHTEKKTFDSVLFKQHNQNVLEIVLNQPKKLNSLDLKMVKHILKRVKQWIPETIETTTSGEESDSEKVSENNVIIPKVVIMTGAGNKAFCAGGDITTLYQLKKQGDQNLKTIKDFFR